MPSFSNSFHSGELAGVLSATQNPDVGCQFVKFFAKDDNVGNVWLGGPGVTVGDGTTDTTTGVPLAKGKESPWIPVNNVHETYRICDNVGDVCYYMVVG
jgi:hypothetical protein